MTTSGVVVSVSPEVRGDTLAAPTAATDMVLRVEDVGDFAEEDDFDHGEQWLTVGDSAPLRYVATDEDAGTITLAAAVGAVYELGDQVAVWDPSVPPSGAPVTEYLANVRLSDNSGTPPAVVPHELIPLAGVDNLAGATVEIVETDPQAWTVAAVTGREPVLDGSYVDPATLPPPAPPTAPPEFSPALTVSGTTNGLVVRADNVEPGTLIAYHITPTAPLDADGDALPFTPDATTLYGEPTRSTVLVITTLPDGTPLAADTTYYLRAVASNEAGEAAPGPQADAQLDLTVVNDQIAATVTAGFLLAGSIQVGQITIDPDTGITIPTAEGGITLPADGSPATFSGHVNASSVQVEDLLVINGKQNRINGQLLLNNVVEAPHAAPSVGWQFPGETTIGADVWSLTDSPDGSKWVTVLFTAGDIRSYSKTTGALIDETTQKNYRLQSITRIGDRYYAAGTAATDGDVYVVVYDAAFAKVNEWRVTNGANIPKQPAIGYDEAGRIILAWVRVQGDLRVQRWTTAGVLYSSELHDVSIFTNGEPVELTNMYRLPVGAAGEVVWVLGGLWDVYRYSLATTVVTDAHRIATRPEAQKGVHWDGTRIRTLGWSSYRIWKWGTNQWPAAVSSAYTWYDSDPAGSGVHETEAGPARVYQPPPFTYLRLYTPVPPDDGTDDAPNTSRLYLDNKLHTNGQPYGSYRIFESVNATGDAPPATNGFVNAAATPGSLTSANGTSIRLRGDGSGKAGPLEWDPLAKVIAAPFFQGVRSAVQSIPHATWTVIVLDSVIAEGGITFTSSANEATIGVDGIYTITAQVSYGTNTTGVRYCRVMRNGTEMVCYQSIAAHGGVATPAKTRTMKLLAGDRLRLEGHQNSGGAINTVAGATEYTHLAITRSL